MRQVVLDTESTGLDPNQGHRLIEIGCIELINRRRTGVVFHRYLQPDRDIDWGAMRVHGISREFLQDKPKFAEIAEELLAFLENSEVIIHNAEFDVGFINFELALINKPDKPLPRLQDVCQVLDTLRLARRRHPGQRNSLDALCKRYQVDNSARSLHGALLDAELLTDVYLLMTGGQTALDFVATTAIRDPARTMAMNKPLTRRPRVQNASENELSEHQEMLKMLQKSSGKVLSWPGNTNAMDRKNNLEQ